MMLAVNPNRCPQNHKCPSIKVCPVGAITQEGFGLPKIDQDKCIKCKKCIQFCPMKAIQEV
ncbi:MAG: 4Fe-4S binding protein [Negativicutes bacterium]